MFNTVQTPYITMLETILTPKCPQPFLEVWASHYSYSIDAKVLELLLVIGQFIMYMGM